MGGIVMDLSDVQSIFNKFRRQRFQRSKALYIYIKKLVKIFCRIKQ